MQKYMYKILFNNFFQNMNRFVCDVIRSGLLIVRATQGRQSRGVGGRNPPPS